MTRPHWRCKVRSYDVIHAFNYSCFSYFTTFQQFHIFWTNSYFFNFYGFFFCESSIFCVPHAVKCSYYPRYRTWDCDGSALMSFCLSVCLSVCITQKLLFRLTLYFILLVLYTLLCPSLRRSDCRSGSGIY